MLFVMLCGSNVLLGIGISVVGCTILYLLMALVITGALL
jgi:hypothetical protein